MSYGATTSSPSPNAPSPTSRSESRDASQTILNQPLLGQHEESVGMGAPHQSNERPKNFPPCKPMMSHDIRRDILQEKRTFIRRAFFSWIVHAITLLWNFICLFAALFNSSSQTVAGVLLALAGVVFGIPFSLWVYWLLYTGMRKFSAAYFFLFFIFFGLQIFGEGFNAIGFITYGSAGFIAMIDLFGSSSVLGFMFAVCGFLWIALVLFNIFSVFSDARSEYKKLGGYKKASNEMRKRAAETTKETIVDNRAEIGTFLADPDNRAIVKEVVVENKDIIVDVAKEAAAESLMSSPTAATADSANPFLTASDGDLMFEHKDEVKSIFDS